MGANCGITSSGLRILFNNTDNNSASGGGGGCGSSLAAGDVAAGGGNIGIFIANKHNVQIQQHQMDGLWPL